MRINLKNDAIEEEYMKFWGFIGILGLIVFWLFFPSAFNWWATNIWQIPNGQIDELAKLGPLGDIYGSLNTLFTSVTLVIVLYSAYLQRQANIDARVLMNKQLQQTKDDIEKQLKQASEATEKQILNSKLLADIQLEHVKKSALDQLELAQKAHDAQIKESQYAIFTNMFQMLMSQKLTLQKDLCSNLKNYQSPQMIFLKMSKEFQSLIENKWTDISKVDLTEIDIKFSETANDLGESYFFSDILYNYFFIYDSILYLIKTSSLEKEQKEIFYKIVSNSMDMYEQLTLLWFSAFTDRVSQNLVNSKILDFEFDKLFLPFCLKFHKRTHFNSQTYINAFKKLKKTPA